MKANCEICGVAVEMSRDLTADRNAICSARCFERFLIVIAYPPIRWPKVDA